MQPNTYNFSKRSTLLIKLVSIFILIIILVSAVIWTTLESGRMLSKTSNKLVTTSVPQMQGIVRLQSSLNHLILNLYTYYATADHESFSINFRRLTSEVQQHLDQIKSQGSMAREAQAIVEHLKKFQKSADSFDQEMRLDDRNWDTLRQLLAEAHSASEQSSVLLNQWSSRIRQEVSADGDRTLSQVSRLTYLHLSFSLIIILISGLTLLLFHRSFKNADQLRRLSIFPERNPVAILRLSPDGAIDYSNPIANQLTQRLKLTEGEQLLPADWQQRFSDPKFRTSNKDSAGEFVSRFEHGIGTKLFQTTAHFLSDLNSYHVYLEDITSRKNAERELIRRALYDKITGLPNRRSLEIKLSEYLSKHKQNRPCSLMLIALDRFEMINSTHGHMVGDQMLKSATQWFERTIKAQNIRARLYRFDSAAWMLMHLGTKEEAAQTANCLLAISKQPLDLGDREITISCSIGATIAPDDATDAGSLLRNADAAMHTARDTGGSSIRFFSEEMRNDAEQWLSIETNLRQAINTDGFELFFQPKVYAANNLISGSEVLIRWKREDGYCSPATFIPIAEQSGLIEQIGDWVLEAACIQWKSWENAGMPALHMAVNISAQQFQRSNFPEFVQATLEKTGMRPEYLELEITEAVAATHPELIVETMQELKNLGISLAIDDFGTGYSSLSYLKRFPLDTLKIDQAFVRKLEKGNNDAAIAWLILSLGHKLNFKVVAEGVETKEQYLLLADWECDLLQGYYFSKPLPPEQFEQFVQKNTASNPG